MQKLKEIVKKVRYRKNEPIIISIEKIEHPKLDDLANHHYVYLQSKIQ